MTKPIEPASRSIAPRDDLWTVAAIAVLASIVANVAHETIGHGAGLLLAGGRSGILTTTRLIVPRPVPDPAWRIFDLGGPAGNLLFAGLAWLGLRLLPAARTQWRLFCWLLMAFSLFWAFGYLLFSGVVERGDWLALLPDHGWPGRVLLAVAGFLLYEASIRIGAHSLGGIVYGSAANVQVRAKRLVGIAWLAGGLIAIAGPALDPRGALEMLNSGALASLGFAVGLLRIPRRLKAVASPSTVQDSTITRSIVWRAAALAASLFFIFVLGRGIAWRL
ncbi:MAG: hypothetical protein WBM14_10390 [Terracidiphilus sp.]